MLYAPLECLAVIVVAFIVAIFIMKRIKERQRLQRQELGLIWLKALRELLSGIQQHRGLSCAYLEGSEEMLAQLSIAKRSVNIVIEKVATPGSWMDENERWVNIVTHWHRLSKNGNPGSVANNLLQHNRLIHNLLCLIDDMAQAHELLLLKTHNGKPFSVVWRELLLAVECVGQIRAVGVSVISSGLYDTVSKIRLQYLVQKVKASTSVVWEQVPPTKNSLEKVENLLLCVDRDLLSEKVTVSASDFFKLATEAVDSLLGQYDHQISKLIDR